MLLLQVKYTLDTTYLAELPGYSSNNSNVLADAIQSVLVRPYIEYGNSVALYHPHHSSRFISTY